MECLSHKEAISEVFNNVRGLSYQEKKSPILDEDKINELLDRINGLRKKLNKTTENVHDVLSKIERLTWMDGLLNEECLMLMNDLISTAKDLRSSLIRQFMALDFLRKKGILKDEITAFKLAIDDLKETYTDLESIFFYLPNIPEFDETTQQLSLV